MFSGANDQAFLPVWRDGQILFFTNIAMQSGTRVTYIVAAITDKQGTTVRRSGKAPITQQQLAYCQSIADDGIGLQKFQAAMAGGNLAHLVDMQHSQDFPFPKSPNRLLYSCLYLDLMRKYLVDEEIVRIYEKSPVKSRFMLEKTVSILKTLSSRVQNDRALKLIESDTIATRKMRGSQMSVANLLRECAIIYYDANNSAEAEKFMLRAAKLHNTEDKWRRLGDFALAQNDSGKTIEYFEKANEMAALPPQKALVLAQAYLDENQLEAAKKFALIAHEKFKTPAQSILDQISKA